MLPPASGASRVRLVLVHGVLLFAALLAVQCRTLDEESIRLALRAQARLSFWLFWLVLASPALARLLGGPVSTWLAQQRAALLQAFAVSHLCHGVWVALFFWLTPHRFELNLFDVSGVLTFPLLALLLALLALPSVAARWGRRAKLVERIAVVYCWVQFVGFFIDRLEHGRPELVPWYWLAIATSVLAGLLALWTWQVTRKARPAAPQT